MCTLRVRFSQSSERRGVFNYALKVEVSRAVGIPSKIFVYHQSPAGLDGNTFAEFEHIATPVDFQEIPEDAASETVPWYRTDKCTVWFRNVSDLVLAKQLFVDDINALVRTFDVLTSENGFSRQTSVEFSENGVYSTDIPEEDAIQKEIDEMKKDISGKISKDAMSGVKLETNTPEGIRAAVQAVGNVLGAKIAKAVAIALSVLTMGTGAAGAGFSGEHVNQIDYDENPIIVTNVTFDGLATLVDITNLIDHISTNFVPALRKEIADASEAGTNYVDSATNMVLSVVEDALQMKDWYPDGSVKSSLEWTSELEYSYDEGAMTAAVLPFCNTGTATNDNSGLVGRVVIPPYVIKDGVRYSVASVAQGVGNPSANSGLTEIIAPSTVVGISDNSVRRCTKLVSISFPGEVSVGQGAFYGCASLSEVSLPLAHTMAGYVFDGGCKALTKVAFPSCTTISGGNVFKDCQELEEVYLPVFTNKIGGSCFSGCGKLGVVDFGAVQRGSIPTLDNVNAFSGVSKSCVIVVPDTNYVAWTTANRWRDLVTNGYRFLKHSEWEYARKYEVDAAIQQKLLFAQYYPDGSVKSAAEFTPGIKYDAPDTTNRTITVKQFRSIDGTAANDNSNLSGRVVIPPFVDGDGNPYISDDGTRYKVVGVSNNSSSSMVNTTNLTAIVAPNTVTNIGDRAFALCTALTSVSLPGVTSIGASAFDGCEELSSVSLPAATSIGSYALYHCTALASVSLPVATTIGDSAFERCAALASVSLPDATSIGSYAFYYCTALASVSLPVATTIGDSAFERCAALASVSLPAAQDIGASAFAFCSTLTSASLPGATSIGSSYTFRGCAALTSVSLPAATTVGESAFASCAALASVSLPAAQDIGKNAFGSCAALKSVSLPAATNIVTFAFSFCSSLTSVDFGDMPRSDVPSLGSMAFNGVPAACRIIVPYAQYADWIAADGWKNLPQEFVRHAEKADRPVTFTEGNFAEFDANGNSVDSGIAKTNVLTKGRLSGETMPANPTQNELAEAVKKIFTALGGTVTP